MMHAIIIGFILIANIISYRLGYLEGHKESFRQIMEALDEHFKDNKSE